LKCYGFVLFPDNMRRIASLKQAVRDSRIGPVFAGDGLFVDLCNHADLFDRKNMTRFTRAPQKWS
jgi:hypothetical protein